LRGTGCGTSCRYADNDVCWYEGNVSGGGEKIERDSRLRISSMMHHHGSYLAPRYRRLPSHGAACAVSFARARACMRSRVCAHIYLFPALPTKPSTIRSLERLRYAWNFVGPAAGELPWCNPRWDCPDKKETGMPEVCDKSACRCSASAGLLAGNVLCTILIANHWIVCHSQFTTDSNHSSASLMGSIF